MLNQGKSDREFVQACLAGNAQAFEALVDKYQALICAITYSGTGRFDTSEELAQETFLMAWRNLQQLKDLGKFREWLCRIARSTVQNWWRKGKRDITHKALSLGEAAEQTTVEFEPSQVLLRKEQAEVVYQALGHIPEKYREPLILFYREEKSTKEVAESLGLSETNARQRIARARGMLRDQVAAMVETTLTGSKPGKAFTGTVMAAVAATTLKRTASAAVVGQASAHLGGSLMTACTGLAGKAALIAAGVVVITTAVLWHQGRQASSPTHVIPKPTTETEISPVTEQQTLDRPASAAKSNDSLPIQTHAPTDTPPQTPIPNQSQQIQRLATSPIQTGPPPLLSGTLTDIDTGEPIAGAGVEISPSGGGRVSLATTDTNGVYAFKTLATYGSYNIRPQPAEHIVQADWERPRETIELHSNRPATRDYALERGCKVFIKAVDEAGQPIKRANFHAVYVSDEMGRGPRDTVRTDTNGLTFVGGLRPDEYLVLGAHRDYALVGKKVKFDQPKEEKSITFTMTQGIEVAGLAICSDDLPASGWEIWAKPIWWHCSHSWPYDNPAAEDGSFLLRHITPGLHRVEVYIPEDGGSRGIWSTEVNLPSETDFLDLHIPHPSPHGRVRLSGAVAFVGGDYDRGFWIHGTSSTGHHGSVYVEKGQRSFTITDLVPGLYEFYIHINGKRTNFKNIQVPREDLLLEVPIASRTWLHAQVVDKQSGEPVTSFKLQRIGEDSWQQITDPNGLIEIASRGQDAQQILIQAPGYSEILSPPITPDALEHTLIEMQLFAALTGRIRNEAGAPIVGATVNYRYRRSRYESPEDKLITETDSEGRFSMRITPRREKKEWFVFRHPDYARVIENLTVSGSDVPEIEVVMPSGGTVQGYAYDWCGALLPDTTIYFMDESSYSYWKQNRARLGQVVTDSNGFYRIDHLPAELCYAFYPDPDRSLGIVKSVVLPQDRQIRSFDIGGTWQASGRLLQQGQPLAHTRLLVTFDKLFEQGFNAYTVTNALGEFLFYGLPSGERSIYCEVPGNRGQTTWIELGSFTFQAGQDRSLGDLELHLAEIIVDLDFTDRALPPQSWDVSIETYDKANLWGRRVGELTPRQHNHEPFVFSHIPLGEIQVIARHPDHLSIHKRMTITPEQKSYALALKIPVGSATLSGTVSYASDEGYAPSLHLRNLDQTLIRDIPIDTQGAFRIEHLPAGRYIIGRSSVANSRGSVLKELTLQPGEQKTVHMSIDATDSGHGLDGYLRVALVTLQGIPLATHDVWLERNGQVIKPHFNGDRNKSFMGQPGIYTLCAHHPGFHLLRTPVEMKSSRERTDPSIYQPVVVTMIRE